MHETVTIVRAVAPKQSGNPVRILHIVGIAAIGAVASGARAKRPDLNGGPLVFRIREHSDSPVVGRIVRHDDRALAEWKIVAAGGPLEAKGLLKIPDAD